MGGYLYQNLIGIELLCDWLEDPTRYEWVKFESDDEVPKGLDDVVAQRNDGLLVLLQVKFTVNKNDSNNLLSWNWLLERKPNGRSLIQKWAAAFFSVGPAGVAEAALVTNRLPDPTFCSSLDEATGRVDYCKIPDDVLPHLLEQLKEEEILVAFLNAFEFRHSHQGDVALERALRDRYIPHHTDSHGWHLLFHEAIDWSVRKNFPPPDGRIYLDRVRGVLSAKRPVPLNQSFRVPEGYCPPDEGFSKLFIDNLSPGDKKVFVLWGSPGQGKSTYLSYLCREFEKRSVPFIRHHYFLELSDFSDRFSLLQVANSLMAQMEAHHIGHVQGLADDPRRLREWIETCAAGYGASGKRFIVVIDGLDHVWRENDKDKRPLDSLFQALLPVPENVTLLVGTQKVATGQLPKQFSSFVDSSDWIEIPRMSVSTIRTWLESQLHAESFELRDECALPGEDQLAGIAKAFERLSGGHPLILTYSFRVMAREQRTLTSEMVDEFPVVTDGDIKQYYTRLWQELSYQAKDALHLIANAGFIWPQLGLETCLGLRVGELGRELDHLLYVTEAGQVAFHGSLLAFVRETAGHSDRVARLLPFVVNWLASEAPDFHRWGWLWLYEAQTGNPASLIYSPSREWVIESLAMAYPREQVVEILSEAERLAFKEGNLARAVKLRGLKTSTKDGPEFQVQDYERLYSCALRMSGDDYPTRILAVNRHAASIARLHQLGTQYLAVGRVADAVECQEQLRKRINDYLRARAFDNDSLQNALLQYLELAAKTGKYSPHQLLRSIRSFGTLRFQLFRFFLSEISKHMDLKRLVDFAMLPMPKIMRKELEVAVIRLAGACRADVHGWPEFQRFKTHPMSACWAYIYAPTQAKLIPFPTYDPSVDVKEYASSSAELTEHYLHGLFFFALSQCLELRGADPVIEEPNFHNRAWLGTGAKHLLFLGSKVGKLLARGETPPFALLFRLSDSLAISNDYKSYPDYLPFRRALLAIATDLFLLTTRRSGLKEIPAREWNYVKDSRHFNFSECFKSHLVMDYQLVSTDVVESEINRELAKLTETTSQFNERALAYIELCELAIYEQLHKLSETLLRRAISCVVGYVWRKNPTLSYVLRAITAVANVDENFGKNSLKRISPIVSQINEMTEDDGTSESDLAELFLKLMPSTYVAYYEHWLSTSEWYSAERVFAELLARESTVGPLMGFVTCAVWESKAIGALRERGGAGDSGALFILEQNARRLGQPVDEVGQRCVLASSTQTETREIDVHNYPPNALRELLHEMKDRSYTSEREAVQEWFSHWREQKQGLSLLRAIEPFLADETIPSQIAELFDEAFEISLAMEGKHKAYRWLAAAQIHRHGWSEYCAEAVALARFSLFATHYPSRWKRFIQDTAKSGFRRASEPLVIGHLRLVQFLLAVDQPIEAKAITEEMIRTVTEDFSDQPLKTPSWFLGY
jgi:hypothetical protein